MSMSRKKASKGGFLAVGFDLREQSNHVLPGWVGSKGQRGRGRGLCGWGRI